LYAFLAVSGMGLLLYLLYWGSHFYPVNAGVAKAATENHNIARLLMALTVIVCASKLFGQVFSSFGQPPVMGEVIAGIALGPSLLGRFAPEIQGFLFPSAILPNLA